MEPNIEKYDHEICQFKGKNYGMNIWTHMFLHTIQVVMSHHYTHPLKLTYLDPGSQLLSNYTKSSESVVPVNIMMTCIFYAKLYFVYILVYVITILLF